MVKDHDRSRFCQSIGNQDSQWFQFCDLIRWRRTRVAVPKRIGRRPREWMGVIKKGLKDTDRVRPWQIQIRWGSNDRLRFIKCGQSAFEEDEFTKGITGKDLERVQSRRDKGTCDLPVGGIQ